MHVFLVVLALLVTIQPTFGSNHSKITETPSQKHDEERHISIAAAKLTNLVNADNTGIYQKLVQIALSETSYQVTEKFLPFRRALDEFSLNRVDCTYSYTEVLQRKLGANAIISSFPLGAFAIYMFTKKDSKAVSRLDELNHLNVGGINGQEQYYNKQLHKDTRLHLLNTDQQGLNMLKLNRLDVLIAALPDLTPYLQELTFDKARPIYKSFDRITCHNNEKNTAFLKTLSTALENLKNNNAYQHIAGEFYIEF